MRDRWCPVVLVVALPLILAAAVSASAGERAVPPPNLGRTVPPNYRVLHEWHERLSGQSVPEVVVTSIGPLNGQTGFHPADLQVLSWDSLAARWDLTFDAEKVRVYEGVAPLGSNQPPGPITPVGPPSLLLDPKGDDQIGQVAFVRFDDRPVVNLVFTAFVGYGGSGQRAMLIILSFQQGRANIAYQWVGQDGIGFRVTNTRSGQQLVATAPYWTFGDAHCCPLRNYRFTIGIDKHGFLTSLSDDLPWLGLYVTPTIPEKPLHPGSNARSPVRAVGIAAHSPAASAFHTGDIIEAVRGARHPKSEQHLLGPAIVDEVETLKAGTQVSFLVDRGGRFLTITVRLGSIIDPSALAAEPPRKFDIIEI
jgi:hypothetical protein